MSTPVAPRFGVLLKTFRKAAGLTQEALAERAGLSTRGLQDLERGVHQTPRRDTVELLAAALGLSAPSRAEFLAATQDSVPPPSLPPPFSSGAPLPLVGREHEVALLGRFLAGAGDVGETTRVLLLAGEPGIGKTRLLQALAEHAVPHGWSVLVSGCQRRGEPEPYAPLLDALARHLQTQPPAQQRVALQGCAWLVRLLPELREVLEPLPAGTWPPAQERRLLDAAVGRLLANVAGPAGTLLVLDDLQWAGPDALDLLATLARTAAGVRVVGAYRDTEVRPADPLGLLLADLAQARLVRHHALGPLRLEDAATLLDDLLAGVAGAERAAQDAVLHHAGGVPFFLVSYAQALCAGVTEAVPWDLGQGVRQRVALLPEPAGQLLGVAAIVGRRVPHALLLAVAGQPEDAVLEGLEAACRARLLLEEGDDGYTFAHDMIREVVEADVGAARRALLHRRVAEALEGGPGGAQPEVLAYHYARGGVPDKAVVYLERAGDHAWAQRAQGAAETHYREVLDRLVTLGRTQDAVPVREKLGRVLYGAGRCDAALPHLQQAAEAFRAAGDWESVVRVTAWMGRAHAVRGTVHEGIALITALLERLDRGGTKTPLAALYEALAVLMFTAGRYAESLVAGERAVELARASGDDATLVRAELGRANSVQLLGRLGEALRAYQDVLALAEAVGDFECLVVIPRDLAYFLALRGAFAPSAGYIARSFVLAAQMGNPALLSLTLAIRGWLAVLGGEWPSARADLEEALALSRQVDRSWYSPYPLLFRARLSLVEGAWTDAMVSAQAAVDLAKRNGDLQALRWASGVMAEIEILEGRAEAARARLAPLLDRPGLQECDVTTLLPVLAWAHLELGQVEQAADAVEQALTRAEPEDMRLVVVEVLRVQALIALRREQWGAAARSLAEGLSLARGLPYPYAEARLLHLDGLLHVQQGEPEAARERLEAARAIFARLGARMDLVRVEQALGALVSQRRAGSVMRRR